MVFDDVVCKLFLEGVFKLVWVVKSILGLCGWNVVLDKGWGLFKVIKDGVMVVEDIEFDDLYENFVC